MTIGKHRNCKINNKATASIACFKTFKSMAYILTLQSWL